jgi:hypothetical protein
MRKIIIATTVQNKISELNFYLTEEFRLSQTAAEARLRRMEDFVYSLCNEVDYPLCRFKRWKKFGYHCAVFEKKLGVYL